MKAPSIREVADKVASVSDTKGTKINVAESKRVISRFQQHVQSMPLEQRLAFVYKNFLQKK